MLVGKIVSGIYKTYFLLVSLTIFELCKLIYMCIAINAFKYFITIKIFGLCKTMKG